VGLSESSHLSGLTTPLCSKSPLGTHSTSLRNSSEPRVKGARDVDLLTLRVRVEGSNFRNKGTQAKDPILLLIRYGTLSQVCPSSSFLSSTTTRQHQPGLLAGVESIKHLTDQRSPSQGCHYTKIQQDLKTSRTHPSTGVDNSEDRIDAALPSQPRSRRNWWPQSHRSTQQSRQHPPTPKDPQAPASLCPETSSSQDRLELRVTLPRVTLNQRELLAPKGYSAKGCSVLPSMSPAGLSAVAPR
jgi:hypothetical protein